MRVPRKWQIDGEKLRELREDLEVGVRELATRAEVDHTTIIDWEHGRRGAVRLNKLRDVAAALAALSGVDIDYRDLVVGAEPRKRTGARIADELPPRSSLDEFVAGERGSPLPALPTTFGELPPFDARALAQTFSAYAAHAGERYYVTGELTTDRGLSFTDCQVLGIEHAIGARFEIARRIEGVAKPLLLTVVTATADHTRQLQGRLRDDVTVLVRLLATRPMTKNDDDVVVIGADFPGEVRRPRRFGDETWQGFEPIQPKTASARPKTHPWALVVDAINPPVKKNVDRPAENRTRSPRKSRKRES